jgi:hypothetical protein
VGVPDGTRWLCVLPIAVKGMVALLFGNVLIVGINQVVKGIFAFCACFVCELFPLFGVQKHDNEKTLSLSNNTNSLFLNPWRHPVFHHLHTRML